MSNSIFIKVAHYLVAFILLFTTQAYAGTPCDFKEVSVGDKMPVAELMKKLGIAKYSMNPKMPDFTAQQPLIDKYGMTGASEVMDFKIGPYCTNNSCRIPYGIKVGIDIPASVFVSFNADSHQIQEIDVAINSTYWDDFVQILKRKYGSAWKSETMPMSIMDYETKKSSTFEREILTHETGGKNSKTQDTCEISATNYDIIFIHNDPLGAYHSVFEIKLISNNF